MAATDLVDLEQSNDDLANWCSSVLLFADDRYGTPRSNNAGCDGQTADNDGDGFITYGAGGTYPNEDCDDTDAAAYPGAALLESDYETNCYRDADGYLEMQITVFM